LWRNAGFYVFREESETIGRYEPWNCRPITAAGAVN